MKTLRNRGVAVVLAGLLLGATGAAQAHSDAKVFVQRGAQSEQASTETVAGVEIIKGQRIKAEEKAGGHEKQHAYAKGHRRHGFTKHAAARRLGAGRTLWLADYENDRLIACRLQKGLHVGESAIRCFDKDLSGNLRDAVLRAR